MNNVKLRGSLLLIGSLVLLNCRVAVPLASPAPAQVTDQSACPEACANLYKLGCAEANDISEGTSCNTDGDCFDPTGKPDKYQTCTSSGACIVTCTNFCLATENTGIWLDPACVTEITSCSQLNACPALAPITVPSCAGTSCKVAPGNAH